MKITNSKHITRDGVIKSNPRTESKYRVWFIIRDGGFSAQEAIQDIFSKLGSPSDYSLKPSFVKVSYDFSSISNAKKFNKSWGSALWSFDWYKQADMSVGGIQVLEGGEWVDLEEM